ncbi:MAG: hypothetical protein KAQ78_08560 [Candidatus Latescibacteria bacterium]|nr:hypothetical protein [Candidatus Latescibacterota bacterium]
MIKRAPDVRGAIRLDMKVPVVYWIAGKEEEKKKATTADVSRTGVGIQMESVEGIEKSSTLGIALNMQGDMVQAEVKVALIKQLGPNASIVGTRFTNISDKDLTIFLKHIRIVSIPLHKLINKEQEGYFVDRLFKGNRERYQETVKILSEIPTWEKASKKIDELWGQYGVDRFSEPSMDFTDIVYSSMY